MKGFDLDHADDELYYRDDIDVLKQELLGLGATHVLTYDELDDQKSIKAKVQEWTNDKVHAPLK